MTTGFQSVCNSEDCNKKDECGRFGLIKNEYQIFRDFLNNDEWEIEDCFIPKTTNKQTKKKKKRKKK